MSLGSALAGGLAGTVVLTSALEGASALGLTRMDIPFLLGTAVSTDRRRARILGGALHFAIGVAFALLYEALFEALGRGGVALGALLGTGHALLAGTMLVNTLLPLVHPRMGTSDTAADEAPLLEPPGFMLLNYGPATPLVTVVAHVLYGAIVGAFAGG